MGPSTTAPDNAPKAASPTRSSAIAAEDISARVSTTNANVFFIRVPCLSAAQHFRLPGLRASQGLIAEPTRESPPFAAGPSHWRKHATFSLSRYSKTVCGTAVTALRKMIQTRLFDCPALRDPLRAPTGGDPIEGHAAAGFHFLRAADLPGAWCAGCRDHGINRVGDIAVLSRS
jgi:hypothetical protein